MLLARHLLQLRARLQPLSRQAHPHQAHLRPHLQLPLSLLPLPALQLHLRLPRQVQQCNLSTVNAEVLDGRDLPYVFVSVLHKKLPATCELMVSTISAGSTCVSMNDCKRFGLCFQIGPLRPIPSSDYSQCIPS